MSHTMVQTVRVCNECGAAYSTSGMTSLHRKATGHDSGFRTIKRMIESRPSIITYNPRFDRIEQH